jgi:DNA mismatch endonuclease (patch repair protein)
MALVSPPASSANARATMRANKGKNTKPELIVRKMLRDAGHPGYRLHWKIRDKAGRVICKPDICYPGKKIAIFVHGCFWHRCPNCNPPMPKKNRDYWLAKFEDNVARDRLNEQQLRANGWVVLTIWECVAQRVEDQLFIKEFL